MNSDQVGHSGDRFPRLVGSSAIDASAAEGLRLVVAFTKIKHQVDRRMVIDLAERLGS